MRFDTKAALMNYSLKIIFFLLFGVSVSGQFYEFGQDPASLKWRHIDTEHFRLIYASDFAENAQNLANLMEKNYLKNSAQLNHKPSKIPLIIHNQTVYSNAFVTWAPKRMELFTFPDPDLFPMDWLNELSLHEFRHVIQIDKLNKGFTHILSIILGQQATGVVAGVIPLWFIEGDAVSAETSLSQSGRGRLPSFEMEIKAQLIKGNRLYPLSKAYLGSYKDYVPDYYQLGYQMVSFARKTYGDDYWTNALDFITRKSFLISPYYFYSKKISGKGQSNLYKNTMTSLKDHWTKSNELRGPELQRPLNIRQSKIYTSYTNPRLLPDSSVVALKTSLNIIPRFVKINSLGEEELIFIPGSMVSGRFSIYSKKIIWDEYVQDIRWKNRSYSVLKEYDAETGKCRKLSRKSKYISPSYSVSGDSIAAINATPDYKFSLIIMNSSNGHILENITSPNNYYLQYPEWIKGTDKIAVIATGEKGKIILLYDLFTHTWTELLKTGFVNVDQLKSSGDYLFFNGGFNGIDEIYSFNLSDKKLRKHTNSELGSFYPDVSADNSQLTFSSYSINGYDIILKTFNPSQQEEFIMPDSINEQAFNSINLKPGPLEEKLQILNKPLYKEKPFSKVSHLFNFHSWAPYWFDYTDPSLDDPHINTGVTLLSQNQLSTAFTSIGYERSNGQNFLHTRFTYKGLFPVFDISTTYGGTPGYAPVKDVSPPELDPNFYTTLSIYVPLTITSGKVISGIQPSFKYIYNSTYYYYFSENLYKRGIGFIEPRLYLYTYLKTTIRDIQPRLGLTIDAKITSAPFEQELYGNIKSLRLNLYIPGLIKNQGIRLRSEWQNQDVDSYYFMNHLSLPRGYPQRTFIKMNKYSIDYTFPILYPDLSAGSLLYIKRIRGNFFVDYMKGIQKYISETVTSEPEYPLTQGLELYADFHLLRFIVEFSSGVRFVYLPHENSFGTELLFTVNLDKFL
jgi:hypothetical protein